MYKIISILLLLTSILYNKAYATPPIFTQSYDDAKKISHDLHLPIIIVVSADWCKWCKVLEQNISNNLDMFENHIILTLDFDRNTHFIEQNNIKKIPTIIYNHQKYVGVYDTKDLIKIIQK